MLYMCGAPCQKEERGEEELEEVTTLKRNGVNKNQMALSLQ